MSTSIFDRLPELATFAGGTGKFTWFHASAGTLVPGRSLTGRWEGTYSFGSGR